MTVPANLDKILDKAYESTPLADLVDAPVAALAGVSQADADALATAFGVKSIGDLGTNKYFRAAAAITDLAAASR